MNRDMPWFRVYNRMIDDDKLRLLAFEDRWHFVALCCLKSEGLLDEPDSDTRTRRIAVRLGVQVRELDEIGRRLGEVELVDSMLNPLAWGDLQYRSDNSTARVKAFRERQQKQPRNKAKRFRNVSETAQEEDTDTDKLEAKASCASDDALKPEHFVEAWNNLAADLGKPLVRDLTPERRVRLRARIAGYSLDDFRTVLANIRGSPFLRGEKQWQGCTFDWVLKKANFQKIIEGNYNG